ncbi:MAG: phosphatidate cytidylyltransferase [Nitriliruptoraceae bacterium]
MSGEPAEQRPRGMVGGRNLPVAILVGVLLAALFLGSLLWRSEAFTVVVVLFAAGACLEAGRVLRAVGVRLLTVVLVLTVVVSVGGANLAGASGQVLGLVVLLVGSAIALLMAERSREVLATLAPTALFGLWIALPASYAVLLVERPDGPVVVLAVIGSAIVADIGGYGFGVPFGRHKIAPSISPNKSWEGFIGGLVVSGALAALVLPLVGDTFTPGSAALLAVLCGTAAFVGDLFESMVKRDLGVKDLGMLLPGHGGILDRVDGILVALPVGHYALLLL